MCRLVYFDVFVQLVHVYESDPAVIFESTISYFSHASFFLPTKPRTADMFSVQWICVSVGRRVYQEAQLSQTDRPTRRVIEYFAKSHKVIELVPFKSLGAFCSNHGSILYHFVTNISFDTAIDWSKITIFFIHPAFGSSVRGSRRNTVMPFGTEKIECCGHPTVEKV